MPGLQLSAPPGPLPVWPRREKTGDAVLAALVDAECLSQTHKGIGVLLDLLIARCRAAADGVRDPPVTGVRPSSPTR
jgi:hypothetical protein